MFSWERWCELIHIFMIHSNTDWSIVCIVSHGIDRQSQDKLNRQLRMFRAQTPQSTQVLFDRRQVYSATTFLERSRSEAESLLCASLVRDLSLLNSSDVRYTDPLQQSVGVWLSNAHKILGMVVHLQFTTLKMQDFKCVVYTH